MKIEGIMNSLKKIIINILNIYIYILYQPIKFL
jgi:hypothetical protein